MFQKSRIYIYLGSLLVICATTLFVYNKYEDKRAGVKSKEAYIKIQHTFEEKNDTTIPEETTNKIEMDYVTVDGYNYIGTINIPSLNLELPIMNDWSYNKMKLAPCRYYGSIYTNDLVICAHAYDSLFGNIKNLKQGDRLILTDIYGNSYVYEVVITEILSPYNVSEMINGKFDLTLYTCTYDNQNRVTVRLNKVESWQLEL